VVLFNASMKENLLYGRPDASDADLRDAAQRAQLLEFIDKLPEGLGDAGWRAWREAFRRRTATRGIARAILKNPAILVLDEATSALDSATEQEVQGALDEAAKGRTTLMVAHRLSTVAGADEIIVLDEGKIVERGAHRELLDRAGSYADLQAGSHAARGCGCCGEGGTGSLIDRYWSTSTVTFIGCTAR